MRIGKGTLFLLIGMFIIFVSYFLFKVTYSNTVTSENVVFDYSLDVDEENKLIKYISEGTTVSNIFDKIELKDSSLSVKLTNSSGIEKKSNDVISSGDVLIIYESDTKNKQYILSVMGDSSGDGDIDLIDLAHMRKHIVGWINPVTNEIQRKTGAYYYALDFNYDGVIDLIDLSKMRKNIVGWIEPSSIKLSSGEISLMVGSTAEIKYFISPINVNDNSVTWSSSDSSVATVDSNGVITAKKSGTATISVETVNGIIAKCLVHVTSYDRIHFIGNGDSFDSFINGSDISDKGPSPSETILLESNGKFALIDTGLANSNSDNPNRAKNVVNYLKKLGVTELEFIIVTHVHYDHMGGASYIIDNIPTKKLYMKVYYGNDNSNESSKENNTTRYENLYNKANDMSIFEKINANSEGKKLSLGNMVINLLATKNLLYYEECYNQDENINSIITYLVVGEKKILLTGDMEPTTTTCLKKFNSSCTGTSIMECVIKENDIKDIDLLKLPHHGYSSCDINSNIVNYLNPKSLVIGNWEDKVEYYYSGFTNNSATIGPVYSGLKSCIDKYFTDYSIEDNNIYYVNNDNVVFDFTEIDTKIYNN